MKKEISEPVVKKNCGSDVRIQAAFIFCAVYCFSFATNKRQKTGDTGRSEPLLFYL